MTESFNPYREWLNVSVPDRPPDHYALLGLARFEQDAEKIGRMADAQKALIRKIRPGNRLTDWQRVLDELDVAKRCLTVPADKEAYDRVLRARPGPEESVLEDPAEQAVTASSSILAGSEESYVQREPAAERSMVDPSSPQPGHNPLPPPMPGPGPLSAAAPEPVAQAPVESLTRNLLPPPMPGSPVADDTPARSTAAVAGAMPAAADGSPVVASTAVAPAHLSVGPLPLLSGLSLDELLPPKAVTSDMVQVAPMTPPLEVAPPDARPLLATGAAVATSGISEGNATTAASVAFPAAPQVAGSASSAARASAPSLGIAADVAPVVDDGEDQIAPRRRRPKMSGPVSTAIAVSLLLLLVAAAVYLYRLQSEGPHVVMVDGDASGQNDPDPNDVADAGSERRDTGGKGNDGSPSQTPTRPDRQRPSSDPDDTNGGGKTTQKDPMPDPNPAPAPTPGPVPNPVPLPIPVPEPSPAPQPDPAPIPDPGPRPDPRPQPNPRPDPAPTPVPTPEPAPPVLTDRQLAELNRAMAKTRELLGARDIAGAQAQFQHAESIASGSAPGPHSAKLERLRLLTEYVGEFWGAFHEALPALADQDLQVGETVVHFLDVSPDRIAYRMQGRNDTRNRQTLPSGLVRAIAESWLKKTAESKVFVGAFMAVDPRYGPEKAREQWQAALSGGAPVGELMPVLDDTY